MENIYSTSYSLYILLKTFGLISLSYDGPVINGVLRVKFYDIAIKLLFVTISVLMIALFCQKDMTISNHSLIVVSGWNDSLFCGLISCLGLNIYQPFISKSICDILKSINSFDKKVSFQFTSTDIFCSYYFFFIVSFN